MVQYNSKILISTAVVMQEKILAFTLSVLWFARLPLLQTSCLVAPLFDCMPMDRHVWLKHSSDRPLTKP